MKTEELPKWLPYSIYIATYHIETSNELEPRNTVQKLFHKYSGIYSKDDNSLNFRSGSVLSCVRSLSEEDSQVFLLAAGFADMDKESLNQIPSCEEYDKQVKSLKDALPEKPTFSYIIRVAYATNEEKAEVLLRRYTKNVGRHLRSAGRIRNCILGMLKGSKDSSLPIPAQELLVLPHGKRLDTIKEAIWTLCFEVCSLALYAGEMSRLYSERKLMFDQMDASESNTQLRINEILAEMRRPIDEIQPSNLENILKEVTIQFSRLSTLASSMRRDYVKAKGLFRRLRNLLKGWNEKTVDVNPTNSAAEIEDFENIVVPFKDFIERTEALMTQLNTVLDSVRTYLGIQQQNVTIMEQISSKEQLVRLVNLQEILHKLEILIVAVYLVEMAKIVFDSLLFEEANLLTAIFIPIALLISILISRILHRNHRTSKRVQ